MKNCNVCYHHNNESSRLQYEIYRSSLWVLRHHPDPAPLKGWLLLDSTRHVSGALDFNQAEASSWGFAISSSSKLVKKITNCSRVYLIGFGEGARHQHIHLIPHFEEENKTRSWNVADFYRLIEIGKEKSVNSFDVDTLVKKARSLTNLLSLGDN